MVLWTQTYYIATLSIFKYVFIIIYILHRLENIFTSKVKFYNLYLHKKILKNPVICHTYNLLNKIYQFSSVYCTSFIIMCCKEISFLLYPICMLSIDFASFLQQPHELNTVIRESPNRNLLIIVIRNTSQSTLCTSDVRKYT